MAKEEDGKEEKEGISEEEEDQEDIKREQIREQEIVGCKKSIRREDQVFSDEEKNVEGVSSKT